MVGVLSSFAPEPSAFMSQIQNVPLFDASWPLRARFESKTILFPSGDHTGRSTEMPHVLSLVKGWEDEPLAFTPQRLKPFVETKPWLVPKGVQVPFGALLPSKAPDEVNMMSGTPADPLPDPQPITQIQINPKNKKWILL